MPENFWILLWRMNDLIDWAKRPVLNIEGKVTRAKVAMMSAPKSILPELEAKESVL